VLSVTCVHDNVEREREFGTVCGECVEINNGTILGIFEFREEGSKMRRGTG
jgi:hypothetical protein